MTEVAVTPEESPAERAMKLLRAHLSPEQLEALDAQGWFHVHGAQGGLYRFYPHWAGDGLVEREYQNFSEGQPAFTSFCVHLLEPANVEHTWNTGRYLTPGDTMLAFMLTLQTDENEFLKRAVQHPMERISVSDRYGAGSQPARERRIVIGPENRAQFMELYPYANLHVGDILVINE